MGCNNGKVTNTGSTSTVHFRSEPVSFLKLYSKYSSYQFATFCFVSISNGLHLSSSRLQNASFRIISAPPKGPRRPSGGAAWHPLQQCIKTDPFSAQAGRGVDSAPAVLAQTPANPGPNSGHGCPSCCQIGTPNTIQAFLGIPSYPVVWSHVASRTFHPTPGRWACRKPHKSA